MENTYRRELIEKIQDYENQISDIELSIKKLQDEENQRTFFQKLLGIKIDNSYAIHQLVVKRDEISIWLSKLKEERAKNYIYGRRYFVKGTKYREDGELPYLILAHIEDDDSDFDYNIVRTKNFSLIPEPKNNVDPNAIKVIVEGYFIGYIDKRYSKSLKKYLDSDCYVAEGEVVASGGTSDSGEFQAIKYYIDLRIRDKKN